jgi:ech hydrogenase subunit E
MGKQTVIPFGPQHPVLPEPIHLDLVLEDEKVVQAIPSIGFIHRGLEKLVEKKEFTEYVYVAERICGICSFIHGMGYCQTIEKLMQVEIPGRAVYLRTMWSELSRVHSHLLWLGLLADGFGFESLFMHTWKLREHILDIFEATTGGRVIFNVCKVGGIRRDVEAEMLAKIKHTLDEMEKELTDLAGVFLNDSSVKSRLVGVGVVTAQEAHDLGAVGPCARASGIVMDRRSSGYAAFKHLDFQPIVDTAGDSYARTSCRVKEVFQSFNLIRQAIDQMPGGDIAIKVTGTPNGEIAERLEQPRGEVYYYAKGNGTKFLERYRVRTPTFANVPFLVKALEGCELADVPLLVLSIDPCISCTER